MFCAESAADIAIPVGHQRPRAAMPIMGQLAPSVTQLRYVCTQTGIYVPGRLCTVWQL